MIVGVPHRSPGDVEREAQHLLQSFSESRGLSLAPPVPVEEIVEQHLRVTLGFDNLAALTGEPRAIGATYMRRGEILIDYSLCPEFSPQATGRYRFTVGHETGHWVLHRSCVLGSERSGQSEDEASVVICRSYDPSPAEVQANRFSAALLMPRPLVYGAWEANIGRTDPLYYEDHTSHPWALGPQPNGFTQVGAVMGANPEYFFRNVARPFAEIFDVSVQAMSIRLRHLGILRASR
jgi:hypothetical protein